MKKEYNLNIKVVTRHPATRNSKSILEARAKFVVQKGMLLYMQNVYFWMIQASIATHSDKLQPSSFRTI